tara:strand:- start:13138 stop:13410 length:273 start_codon:yes stop_codon:yes gene_type:complete
MKNSSKIKNNFDELQESYDFCLKNLHNCILCALLSDQSNADAGKFLMLADQSAKSMPQYLSDKGSRINFEKICSISQDTSQRYVHVSMSK